MIETKITPIRPALKKGTNNEIYALFRATTRERLSSENPSGKLNLSLVIDKSGSMSGRPLHEAKRCAIKMIEQMSPRDRVSVIAYDNHATTVVPSTLCSDRRVIFERVRAIEEGGQTALHDGWLHGAEEVARYRSDNLLNRVLLLSDGNANVGLSSVGELKSQCARLADAGITTSTYGLGQHFNEELMIEMASGGLGQAYYGETAEDLYDPFREEFELMLNTVAKSLKLTALAPEFVGLKMMNNFRSDGTFWSMPDIASGGEAWALFKLTIAATVIRSSPLEVLRCSLSYYDMNGRGHTTDPVKLILEPLEPTAFEAIVEDEKVRARMVELLVADLQREARDAARRHDWNRVESIIVQARNVAKDNEWMKHSLDALEKHARQRRQEQFSKEAVYSSDRLHKRLMAADEEFASYSAAQELEKAAYLRRKTERGKGM
jgi:Ca-activated chloride channel family protein